MLTTVEVLAQNNFGDTRTGGLAGPMGLFLIVALATVTVLLIRNMNARLRRLPDRFPQQGTPAGPIPQSPIRQTGSSSRIHRRMRPTAPSSTGTAEHRVNHVEAGCRPLLRPPALA